jgi:hypothetical protein
LIEQPRKWRVFVTKPFDATLFFTSSPPYEPAPLVDEAIAATEGQQADRSELGTLRLEIDELKASLTGVAAGIRSTALAEARAMVDAKPVKAAIIVGTLAFLYGVTR